MTIKIKQNMTLSCIPTLSVYILQDVSYDNQLHACVFHYITEAEWSCFALSEANYEFYVVTFTVAIRISFGCSHSPQFIFFLQACALTASFQ